MCMVSVTPPTHPPTPCVLLQVVATVVHPQYEYLDRNPDPDFKNKQNYGEVAGGSACSRCTSCSCWAVAFTAVSDSLVSAWLAAGMAVKVQRMGLPAAGMAGGRMRLCAGLVFDYPVCDHPHPPTTFQQTSRFCFWMPP